MIGGARPGLDVFEAFDRSIDGGRPELYNLEASSIPAPEHARSLFLNQNATWKPWLASAKIALR